MADVNFIVEAPAGVALVTGTALKTMLQVQAPTNQRIKVTEWSCDFQGINPTDQPIRVRLLLQTTAGTGLVANTPVKNGSFPETIQSTALDCSGTTTAEPTSGAILETHFVHPQGGFAWQAPWGKHYVIPGGSRVAIDVTAAVSVNCLPRLVLEE